MRKELSRNNKIKKAKLPLGKMADKEKNYVAQEVPAIRNEINSFKMILTQKADIDILKMLEARLVRVEQCLKLPNY